MSDLIHTGRFLVEKVQRESNEAVVLKSVQIATDDWNGAELLSNEWEKLQLLEDVPGIRSGFALEQSADRISLVLEYVDGPTLREYLAEALLSLEDRLSLADLE